MARITASEAQAWAEPTKLPITSLDAALLDQVETQVLGKIRSQIDSTIVSTWVDAATTPKMVRTIIAMFYVAWYYDKMYSEEQEALNDYAVLLRAQAESLLVGILDGSLVLEEVPNLVEPGGPSFYPNDASSSMCATDEDPSLGPEAFTMSAKF